MAPISGREDYGAAWTGLDLFVWGGLVAAPGGGVIPAADGARYSPRDDAWHVVAASPLSARAGPTVVALASRVLVWGGFDPLSGDRLMDGALYDPTTDTWSSVDMPVGKAAEIRSADVIAADGFAYLLTTGTTNLAQRFDATDGSWEVAAPPPDVPDVDLATAVWTGREIIWLIYPAVGPNAFVLTYVPKTNSWSDAGNPTPLARSAGTPALWTGAEIVTMGNSGENPYVGAAAYDPRSSTWRPMDGIADCTTAGAVWTGAFVLTVDPARAYDPRIGRCGPLPDAPLRPDGAGAREGIRAVWTGSEVFAWSGSTGRMGDRIPADGVAFTP